MRCVISLGWYQRCKCLFSGLNPGLARLASVKWCVVMRSLSLRSHPSPPTDVSMLKMKQSTATPPSSFFQIWSPIYILMRWCVSSSSKPRSFVPGPWSLAPAGCEIKKLQIVLLLLLLARDLIMSLLNEYSVTRPSPDILHWLQQRPATFYFINDN